ncbi:MAG TPA: hypothetical protein VK773_12130, partial [Acidimicrobiales bacterium]|nr:hypothetical protein [Acidimicrobiales bacterium]
DHDDAEPADAAAHQLAGRFVDDPVTSGMVGGNIPAAASSPSTCDVVTPPVQPGTYAGAA